MAEPLQAALPRELYVDETAWLTEREAVLYGEWYCVGRVDDLGLAWNIADRIAVMYLGRVVECGSTEEVLSKPRHPYTKALLSVVPEIDYLEPVVLTGEVPDPSRIPAGCRFHPRCPQLASGEADAAGVVDHCRTVPLDVLPAVGDHRVACHLERAERAQRASE